MSWRDIIDKACSDKEERYRQEAEIIEAQRQARERQAKNQVRETRIIARNFLPRVKPVFEEFARRQGWGRIRVDKNANSWPGNIILYCSDSDMQLLISPPKIVVMTYSVSSMSNGCSSREYIVMTIGEFTEEAFAEALVKAFLK